MKTSTCSQPANAESEEFLNLNVASGLEKDLKQDPTTSTTKAARHLKQAANKFCGKPLSKIYVLEIFAGSARLSKAALEQGFASIATDHKSERASGISIQHYALTDPSHLESLVVFIKENKDDIAMVWMAPPCGTASKARERPLKHLEKLGMSIPKPLRSKEQPDQLDGLGGLNKVKTETANILYDAVNVTATTCYNLGIFVVVENPGNSHFWSTSPIAILRSERNGHYVSFHNCCHSGDRDKLTSLWVTQDWLENMEATWDKQHAHKAWAPTKEGKHLRFPTAEEAAYPVIMCSRIISKLATVVMSMGATITETLEQQLNDSQDSAADHLVLGALPRGRKIKPLVAEFGAYKFGVSDPQRPSDSENILATLPKGAKVISRHIIHGEKGRDEFLQKHSTDVLGKVFSGNVVEICTFGVPSNPSEFLETALRAGHPKSLENYVSQTVHDVAMDNFHLPPHLVAKKCIEFIKKWSARASALRKDEEEFKQKLEPYASQVLKGKRLILVLEEILQSLDYLDKKNLVQDIARGFPLSGWRPKSNVFPTGTG